MCFAKNDDDSIVWLRRCFSWQDTCVPVWSFIVPMDNSRNIDDQMWHTKDEQVRLVPSYFLVIGCRYTWICAYDMKGCKESSEANFSQVLKNVAAENSILYGSYVLPEALPMSETGTFCRAPSHNGATVVILDRRSRFCVYDKDCVAREWEPLRTPAQFLSDITSESDNVTIDGTRLVELAPDLSKNPFSKIMPLSIR